MRMGGRRRRRRMSFLASPIPSTPPPVAVMGIQTEGNLTVEAVEFRDVATGHHHGLCIRTGRVTGAVKAFEKVEDLGVLLDGMPFMVTFDGLHRDEPFNAVVIISRIEGKGVSSTVSTVISRRDLVKWKQTFMLLNGVAKYEITPCEDVNYLLIIACNSLMDGYCIYNQVDSVAKALIIKVICG